MSTTASPKRTLREPTRTCGRRATPGRAAQRSGASAAKGLGGSRRATPRDHAERRQSSRAQSSRCPPGSQMHGSGVIDRSDGEQAMILEQHVTVVDKRAVRRPRGLWGRGLWACVALVFGALASCTSTSATGPPASTTPGAASVGPTGVTSSSVPSTTSSTVATPPTTTGPPQFIWGYGDPLICGTPSPSETAQATAAARRHGPLQLPASARTATHPARGRLHRVQSVAGPDAVGRRSGIATDQGSVFGCGVASGQITTTAQRSDHPQLLALPCPRRLHVARALAQGRDRPS